MGRFPGRKKKFNAKATKKPRFHLFKVKDFESRIMFSEKPFERLLPNLFAQFSSDYVLLSLKS